MHDNQRKIETKSAFRVPRQAVCPRIGDIATGAKAKEFSGTGFGQLGRLIKITKEPASELTVAPWNPNLMTRLRSTHQAA
jgi:hypothetical protein